MNVFFGGKGNPSASAGGVALLSMPVRLLRHLTGTALRAAIRSLPSLQAPILSPARFYQEG